MTLVKASKFSSQTCWAIASRPTMRSWWSTRNSSSAYSLAVRLIDPFKRSGRLRPGERPGPGVPDVVQDVAFVKVPPGPAGANPQQDDRRNRDDSAEKRGHGAGACMAT